LPIGNGRMGAMIFGGVLRERIALNEETVWSGSRVDWNRHGASKNLPKIRACTDRFRSRASASLR
jgi:alpha-L-fucosidase 2